MNTTTILLMLMRAGTVVAGAAFLWVTWEAYRKHRDGSILWLAAAISLMVLAAAAELTVFLILGARLGTAEAIEAALTMVAFLVLLVSVRRHA